MGDNSLIEWTDATWQVTSGCDRCSPGCQHCYAERLVGTRLRNHPGTIGLSVLRGDGEYHWTGEIRLRPENLTQPLAWGKPRRIFVNSLSDLFHPDVPFDYIDEVFAVAAMAPRHTFQMLTKRPERAAEYLSGGAGSRVAAIVAEHIAKDGVSPDLAVTQWPLRNVWLGTSVEDQQRANERVHSLLECDAAIRFLSCEPLLGPLDISPYMWPVCGSWTGPYMSAAEAAANGAKVTHHRQSLVSADARFIDWVIVGGESGPHARPMHPGWATGLRDQCVAAGVPFLFKQWGEWVSGCKTPLEISRGDDVAKMYREGLFHDWGDGNIALKVGKKAAGRLLDGRTWDQFPETSGGK